MSTRPTTAEAASEARTGDILPAEALPAPLLTVPGRRTGVPHAVVVGYLPHGGGHLVAASPGGARAEPQCIRDLAAASTAQVQVGRTVTERRSGRVIPVAVLTPASP